MKAQLATIVSGNVSSKGFISKLKPTLAITGIKVIVVAFRFDTRGSYKNAFNYFPVQEVVQININNLAGISGEAS